MRLGIIIICRYNSNRLPGKILKRINDKSVLQYIFERLNKVVPKDHIVVATSKEETDKPIVDYCIKHGLNYFQGSLDNVAERFLKCGEQFSFDYIVRINGDNIFIDIKSLEEMIQVAMTGAYDFISNVKERTFPKGMSVEIIKTLYYKKMYEAFNTKEHFEHVTLYLYNLKNQKNHFYYYNKVCPEAAGVQLAIDDQEDFNCIKEIISNFEKDHTNYGLEEIFRIYKLVKENG